MNHVDSESFSLLDCPINCVVFHFSGPFGTLTLPAAPSTLKHGKLAYENFWETFVVIVIKKNQNAKKNYLFTKTKC